MRRFNPYNRHLTYHLKHGRQYSPLWNVPGCDIDHVEVLRHWQAGNLEFSPIEFVRYTEARSPETAFDYPKTAENGLAQVLLVCKKNLSRREWADVESFMPPHVLQEMRKCQAEFRKSKLAWVWVALPLLISAIAMLFHEPR